MSAFNQPDPGMVRPDSFDDLAAPPIIPANDLQHVAHIFQRIGLGRFVKPIPPRLVWAVYVFVNSFISIALLALLAVVARVPLIFPSLGPTAYLLFFSPRSEASTPRNALIGHGIGLICGYAAYQLMGMPAAITAPHTGFNWYRIIAAALSLAAAGALMILFNASHPPAGATTLIVSLGIITKPTDLVIIEAAVVLLIVQAFCLNRLAGVHYPIWKYPSQPSAISSR